MSDPIQSFRNILRAFVRGEMSAGDFEARFIETWNAAPDGSLGEAFAALEQMFFDVDAFCLDPALRDDGDLDEAGLTASAEKTLAAIDC